MWNNDNYKKEIIFFKNGYYRCVFVCINVNKKYKLIKNKGNIIINYKFLM